MSIFLQYLLYYGAIASAFLLAGHMAYKNVRFKDATPFHKRAAPFGGDRNKSVLRGLGMLVTFFASIPVSLYLWKHGFASIAPYAACAIMFVFVYAAVEDYLKNRAAGFIAGACAVALSFFGGAVAASLASYVFVVAVLYVLRGIRMTPAIIASIVLVFYDMFATFLLGSMEAMAVGSVAAPTMIPAPKAFVVSEIGAFDVIFPGLFIMTVLRESYARKMPMLSYAAVLGYFIGLSIGLYVVGVCHVSQPGMAYIVPVMLAAFFAACRYKKILMKDVY